MTNVLSTHYATDKPRPLRPSQLQEVRHLCTPPLDWLERVFKLGLFTGKITPVQAWFRFDHTRRPNLHPALQGVLPDLPSKQ